MSQSVSFEDIEFVPFDEKSDSSTAKDVAEIEVHGRESVAPMRVTLEEDSLEGSKEQGPVPARRKSFDKEWKKLKSEKKHKKKDNHRHHHRRHKHDHKTLTNSKSSHNVIPYLNFAVAEYGEPTVAYLSKHSPKESFAYWSKRDLKKSGHPELERVTVRGHGHTHQIPQVHQDHCYTTIIYKIPADKVFEVLKLSDSLTYDRLSHELTSRCAGWRTNSAILYLACRMAAGHISLNDAQDRKVLEKMMKKAARSSAVAKKYSQKLAEIVQQK